MEMIENKQTQKRRMPHMAKIVLAAALAVGCVLSIAAGLPARMYNFMSGGTLTVLPGTDQISMTMDGEGTAPVTVEDGRLWFEADGQKIDITDKVDENTPYIHEHTDAATGEKGYLVVGGTPEEFGWAEIAQMGEDVAISGSNFAETGIIELPDSVDGQDNDPVFQVVDAGANRPWFQAALDQLGIKE